MICAEFKRVEEGFYVDAEFRGYGNADIIEAFKMEEIDIVKVLNEMKIGETKVYNIGWYSSCGIAKRGVESQVIKFGNN